MGELAGDRESFEVRPANVCDEVKHHLDERARRLLPGAMAPEIGHGGISLVAEATSTATDPAGRGAAELEAGIAPDGRIRREGAGRKPVTETDPGILAAPDEPADAQSRGDPMPALRWTTKSTAKLADALTRGGHPCSPRTAAPPPRRPGFSPHGNSKTIEGRQHPDRDARFRSINDLVAAFQAGGQPVISVDTNKKELTGTYPNAGTEWSRGPERVNDHDLAGRQPGKIARYGVHDLTANAGWVNAGTSADTAALAVQSIGRWREQVGRPHCPQAARLLSTADSGGSNRSRLRLWKTGLATLAAQTGVEITVAHFPPGTSRWTKVEHRLFSLITMNWRARPLISRQVVIETIAAAATKTGLRVRAMPDTGTCEKGIKISGKEMRAWEARHLHRHDFHGDWNYTVTAESATDPA